MARILVVEDEPSIQELISVTLTRTGHDPLRAADAETALRLLQAELPDLVLLDWMLPGQSGIDLARRLRADERTRGVPIIMLTARGDEQSKVTGLETGADDYVTKPFHPTEVLARIEAVLRRSRSGDSDSDGECVTYADLTVDMQRLTVQRGQQAVALTPTELRLLVYLMRNAERVVSRGQILDQVWQYDFRGEGMVVEKVVSNLRKKIDAGGEPLIHTVRGFGYSLRRCAG